MEQKSQPEGCFLKKLKGCVRPRDGKRYVYIYIKQIVNISEVLTMTAL